jgi:hypothetical protein
MAMFLPWKCLSVVGEVFEWKFFGLIGVFFGLGTWSRWEFGLLNFI